MAYVPFSEEEQNKSTEGALPTTGGGSSGTPAAGSSATPQTSAQPAPQGGGQGFANLNQYLGANKGQGTAEAGTIASNLGNQYTGLQGDINNAANQATEAIKGGSTAYDQNLVQGAVANPSQFAADPNNIAAWQKQYNAAYTGPTAFENTAGYGSAANAANKANQTYQLGQTGGGYTQLLNQIEKNPTAGRTALDKSLIQSDPNAQNTIQGALTPFKGIQDYVSGKSAEIGKQASDAAQATGEAATKTKEALTGAQNTLGADVTNRYQTGLANQTNYNKQVEDLQKSYQPYQDAINNYQTNVGQTYGDPFAGYKQYQPAQTAITPESQATQQQFANEAAFEKLGGQPSNILSNDNQPDYTQFKDTDAYNRALTTLSTPNLDQSSPETTAARQALISNQGKLEQGKFQNVPKFNANDIDSQVGGTAFSNWYQKAAEDAARKGGWTPSSLTSAHQAMTPEFFLKNVKPDSKFNQLIGELQKSNPNFHLNA